MISLLSGDALAYVFFHANPLSVVSDMRLCSLWTIHLQRAHSQTWEDSITKAIWTYSGRFVVVEEDLIRHAEENVLQNVVQCERPWRMANEYNAALNRWFV